MKKNKVFPYLSITFAILFFLVACEKDDNTPEGIAPGLTNTISNDAFPSKTPRKSTVEENIIITPNITATPIFLEKYNENQINQVIENTYSIDPKCKLDLLKFYNDPNLIPTVQLYDFSLVLEGEEFTVIEYADNLRKTFRAYIACEKDLCQPKVYIKNLQTNITQEIDWSGRIPYRPTSRLMWIGEEVITFVHSTSPSDDLVVAYQVEKNVIEFYWLVNSHCE